MSEFLENKNVITMGHSKIRAERKIHSLESYTNKIERMKVKQISG